MHRSGVIVLISGDIDFAETVHDLVHTGGYEVVLVHNRQTRKELCQNASKALSFESIVGNSEAIGGKKSRHCPGGHGTLKSFTHRDGFNCNLCSRAFPAGTAVYGCRKCDGGYDECQSCYTKAPDSKLPHDCSQDKTTRTKSSDGKGENKSKGGPPNKSAVPKAPSKTQKKGQFPCTGCDKVFASAESRDQHAEATGHASECDECGRVFQSENALKQHQTATGHEQMWDCNECGKEFRGLLNLARHLDATQHNRAESWNCDICDKAFDRLMDCLDHERLDHESGRHFESLCAAVFF
jgi:hypothetical protein